MSRPAVLRAARRLALVPVLSVGLGAVALPASADTSHDAVPQGHAFGHFADGAPSFAARPYSHGDGRKVR